MSCISIFNILIKISIVLNFAYFDWLFNLINYLKNNLDKKLLIKILVLLNIILIVSIQTKISFMLSSFIILSIFHLLHIKKN